MPPAPEFRSGNYAIPQHAGQSAFEISAYISTRYRELKLPRHEWSVVLRELQDMGAAEDMSYCSFTWHIHPVAAIPGIVDIGIRAFRVRESDEALGGRNSSDQTQPSKLIYQLNITQNKRFSIDAERILWDYKKILIDSNGFVLGLREGTLRYIGRSNHKESGTSYQDVENFQGFEGVKPEFRAAYGDRSLEILREIRENYRSHPDFNTTELKR